MIRRLLGACVGVAVLVTAGACDSSDGPGTTGDDIIVPVEDAGSDAGTDDAGPGDAGTDDAGSDAGPDDAGPGDAGSDAGTDAGPNPGTVEGPWPTDAVTNYSSKYGLRKVRSVGVDAAYNIWLLDGPNVGVLRADTKEVVWTSHPVGQASLGFGSGPQNLATNSRVICGGKAGEAYVGYEAPNDIPGGQRIAGRGEADFSEERYFEFQKGDVDVVRLDDAGKDVVLREHIYRSAGSSRPSRNEPLGIRNSNDFHYDEDRSVYSCVRVTRGPYAGEVYIGTNHGVTRIREYEYSSHRHPAYWTNGSQRAGYTFGLGISQEGHLLVANDWKIGIIPPNASLAWWDSEKRETNMPADVEPAIFALNVFVSPVNPGGDEHRSVDAPFNYWRGFQQTKDGLFYVASLGDGLWQLELKKTQEAPLKYSVKQYTRIEGINTRRFTALAATDDGSLFVGTESHGLWRLTPTRQLEKVKDVSGAEVTQLVYDPTVTPAMLYALIDGRLTVLRGY